MKSPFKFLDSYTLNDRGVFFGREQEIEEMYQKIFESRILLLYGISGTGKTSLIDCGLASKFEESDWLPVHIRRGSDMLESLRRELKSVSVSPVGEGAGVPELIRSVYLDYFKPIYLIFDQFEELFIFGERQERDDFIQSIRDISDGEYQCRCLFSIREEFLAGVTEFEAFIPDFMSNRMRIEKMTFKHAREVIEGPCRVHGIEVEDAFAEHMLRTLNPASNEVELTYLQVLLDRVFTLAGSEKKLLIRHIREAGEVGDLLGRFLDEQLKELENPDTGLTVLKAFVSMKGTKRQIGQEEIRDFALTLGQHLDPATLTSLLQLFVNLRVLREKDEQGQFELRHDSLAGKIYEKITFLEKELLEIKEFLDGAHQHYLRRGSLLGETDLKYIAPYEDRLLTGKEIGHFIAVSKREIRRKQIRKRRMIVVAVLALMVILSVFTAWAIRERGKAMDQQKAAEVQKEQALEARDEAIRAREEAIRAREDANLSRSEAEQSREEALSQKQVADSALVVAEFQRGQSEEQRIRAEQLFEEASMQSRLAQEAQVQAEEAALAEQESNRKAMFQLYLFNAQEFASQSLLLEKSDTLAALLALEAFALAHFGHQHFADDTEDYGLDTRLHEALQKALLRLEDDILYAGVHWALDMNKEWMAIGDQKDQVLISEVLEGSEGYFSKLEPRSRRDLNQRLSDKLDGTVESIPKDAYVRHLAIDHGQGILVSGDSEGGISLTDLQGIGTRELYSHEGSIMKILLSPEHGRLISTGRDQSLVIYDLEKDLPLYSERLEFHPHDLSILRRHFLLLHDQTGSFFILDLRKDYAAPEPYFSLNHEVEAFALCSSRDMMAVTGKGKLILKQLDGALPGAGWQKEFNIPHTGMISDICFSPDGNWLALSGYDGIISLWDLSAAALSEAQHLSPILHFSGMRNRQLFFDYSGRYLVYSNMKSIHMYPIEMEHIVEQLRDKLQGKRLSDKEWSSYVKGEIQRPKADERDH